MPLYVPSLNKDLRPWPNIKPTLEQRVVFAAGIIAMHVHHEDESIVPYSYKL